MYKPSIICISGVAGSGKDTLAEVLQYTLKYRYNKKILIVHNADLVKYAAKIFFKWDGSKNEEGRTLLQTLGTDLIRNKEQEDYWVNFLITMVKASSDMLYDYIIIPDCRFLNEINRWIDEGFTVYSIKRVRDNLKSKLTDSQKNHSSETSINDIQCTYCCDSQTYQELSDWSNIFCTQLISEDGYTRKVVNQ